MRFLCDVMLGRLARWLRAAGHDALLADDAEEDRRLLDMAAEEGRILLTLDRRLARRRAAPGRVVLLHSESVAEQASELRRGLGVDWLRAPFSRCVVDNTLLRPAGAEEVAALPEKVRALGGPVSECPLCHRLYWPGDHHRRMRERLESWQEGGGA